MIPEDVPRINKSHIDGEYAGQANHLNRRPSAMPDIRIPLNARIIPKQLADKAILVNATKVQGKKKKDAGEEGWQEGGENAVGYFADFHHNLDAL